MDGREGRDPLELMATQGQRGALRQRLAAGTAIGDGPVEVRLTTNGDSWSALGTTSAFVTDTWTIDKLTLNLGARFDRYRVYLPEQHVAAGRFVPQAVDYPAESTASRRSTTSCRASARPTTWRATARPC